MRAYGNVASTPIRKESKSTGKGYWEFRIAEAQKNDKGREPTWYSVRVMRDEDPKLSKGDFVKVTGALRADFYLSRAGAPTGTLLIIAFEATKIAKPSVAATEVAIQPNQDAPAVSSRKVDSASLAAQPPPEVQLSPKVASTSVPVQTLAQAAPDGRPPQQLTPMRTLPAFALPSAVPSPWAMSFHSPSPIK